MNPPLAPSPARLLVALSAMAVTACGHAPAVSPAPPEGAARAVRVFQTSAAGDQLADLGVRRMTPLAVGGPPALQVDLGAERQEIIGFGGAFTEATAHVLQGLAPALRAEVLERYFGPDGAWYSLNRTHLASCDFCPRGKYAYATRPDLSDFSVAEDEPDLLPLIKDAMAVRGASFRLIASPWSAPPFMKSGGTGDGYFGGTLLPAHYATFAAYIARYVQAYRAHGVPIWAVTPVNEPLGNGDQWESMLFTPESMARFIREDLGPTLTKEGVEILAFDQNRGEAEAWVTAILGDPETKRYVLGTAVHWYGSTFAVFEDVLDRIHAAHPDRVLLNSEATIDVIWDDPAEWEPPPVVGAQQDYRPAKMHYWQDWAWWWQVKTTDWGYRWASPEETALHPRYSAANRYIRDIIVGLNHWFVGWVDWNLVLDERGGPNHVGNFCAAPVLVDAAAGEVFYTPLYFVMSHFSRFIRPGARVLGVAAPDGLIATAARNPDGTVAVVVANIAARPDQADAVVDRAYRLRVGDFALDLKIPARAIQTLVIGP